MSSISDRSMTAAKASVLVVALVLFMSSTVTECRPQQQAYLPPSGQQHQLQQSPSNNNAQTFYVPPAGQQQLQQIPFLASSSNQQPLQQLPQQQQQQSLLHQNQHHHQQQLTEPPIQLQIPIPNDGVEEKKIYVQLPPQQHQYPQQPQYRYPPRKHYKIILVRSPSPPTPPPAPVLPEIEEQTLVYVLVKKPDTPSVAELQQQQQQSFKLNKPEVYFIKYKANEQRSEDGSLGSATASEAINSPQALEKSIEHQLSNNLEGSSGNSGGGSGGGGYSYDASRKREAKNLNQTEEDEEVNKVTKDLNQK